MSRIAGAFRLEGEPAAGPALVFFDGRLDNRDELARVCPRRAGDAADTPDAHVVLSAYQSFGDGVASRLNGDFALAIEDPARQRLILARDVMAARPLYYCQVPGALLYASEIKCLLADSRVTAAPDLDAIAELVLDYWCDVHRTCFAGIFSVPPGCSIVVTRDGIERRMDWAFDPSREVRYGCFGDYRDHFRAVFEDAVRRRLRSVHPVAITVSGGLDSSSIFCQAATLVRRESRPVALRGIAMTFPRGTPADEEAYLDCVARAYDTPISRIPVERYRFLVNADAVVRQFETPGVVSDAQADIFGAARQAGCHTLLSGFFGDQMLADTSYLVDLARRGRWLRVRRDLRECARWMTDAGTMSEFVRDFAGQLIRMLPPRWLHRLVRRSLAAHRGVRLYPPWFTVEFRRRAVARAATRFDGQPRGASIHAAQCYRHATAGHYVNSIRCEYAAGRLHGIDVAYPFRDRDLVAYLMAIPGEIVNWQGVPKGLLRHALRGVLPDAIRDRRWKADFTPLENQAVRQGHAELSRLLSRDCLSARAGFVDGSILEQALAAFGAVGDEDMTLPGWRLTDLAGLELWLRNFFGDAAAAA